MSTVALLGISARLSIFALGPKGPLANMELRADMPVNATLDVIISKYCSSSKCHNQMAANSGFQEGRGTPIETSTTQEPVTDRRKSALFPNQGNQSAAVCS